MTKHDLFWALVLATSVFSVVLGVLFHLAEKEAATRHHSEPDLTFEWRLVVAAAAIAGTIVLVTR